LIDSIRKDHAVKGKKVLFPRSALPNPTLKKALEEMGAQVWEVAVYDNVKPPKKELPQADIDKIVFTSPSTVDHFLQDFKSIPSHWQVVCRGSLTQSRLKQAGYHSTIVVC
jgi:uroporphyrinogen-III synthase